LLKLREEELNAKYLLEKLVYKGRRFFNVDKPDIRDAKGKIGVEHRMVTTTDAMLMEKYLEHMDLEAEGLPGGKLGALLLENELLDTDGDKREKSWKLKLLELGVREKLEKLNEGGYDTFPQNELFLTMREYQVTDGLAGALAELLPSIQQRYVFHFDRVYLFGPNDLYIIENRSVVDKIPLHQDLLIEMEENTKTEMQKHGR
jgi:hypothetical protein